MTNLYKQSAKTILNGYWLRAVTVVMVILGVSAFPTILMQIVLALTETDAQTPIGLGLLLFATAVGSLLASPIMLGFNRILWLRTAGEKTSLSEVLYLYGNPKLLFKYLVVYIVKGLLVAVPAGVVIAPSVVISSLSENLALDAVESVGGPFAAIMSLGMLALMLIGLSLFILQAVRYSLIDFAFIKHSDKSVGFILGACSKLCLKRFKLIVSLYFSFFGWILLNATGFGRLYTTPYLNAALASAARQFIAEDDYNQRIEAEAEAVTV